MMPFLKRADGGFFLEGNPDIVQSQEKALFDGRIDLKMEIGLGNRVPRGRRFFEVKRHLDAGMGRGALEAPLIY